MREPDALVRLREQLDAQGFKLVARAQNRNFSTLDYLYPGLNESEGAVLAVRVTLEELGRP